MKPATPPTGGESGIELSILMPLVLGVFVGVRAAIMGVGGGFIMVPVMVYLLRMPMHVVVGTSLFQTLFTCIDVTIMQANTNHTVDFVLALIRLTGPPEDRHLKQKGRALGVLWMNLGSVEISHVPGFFLLYLPGTDAPSPAKTQPAWPSLGLGLKGPAAKAAIRESSFRTVSPRARCSSYATTRI